MLNVRLVFGVFWVVHFASIEKVVLSGDAEPSKILHIIFCCVIHRILVHMALVGESMDTSRSAYNHFAKHCTGLRCVASISSKMSCLFVWTN